MTDSDSESVSSIVTALIQRQYNTGRQYSDSNDSATLGRLLSQQKMHTKLQQHLLQTLEFWPQSAATVSHLHEQQLVIRCPDGSSASRVRFMQPDIVRAVQAYSDRVPSAEERSMLRAVSSIRITICP